MAVYVVGDFLRETRLRKGYTQEEVSYGICTPASLSRIENGAQKPGRLILEKLFERLGTENNLFNSFVSREEMELYSAIQSLIRDINDERNIMDAIHLDLWLKEYMENRIVDGRMKTAKYPMILYNLSCWFGDKNCHKEALKMADEGVNFCIQYGNLAFFPILLFNEGGTLVELGEIDKGKEHLHQAITIFKAMRRKDMVQTAIEWCKIHYQIDF